MTYYCLVQCAIIDFKVQIGGENMFTTSLSFNGKAEEALNFYAKVFGYKVRDADVYKWENGLIAYTEMSIYGNKLMLADVEFDESGLPAHADLANTNFSGFSFSINLTDEAELRDIFAALSEEAEIIMPLAKVEWSDCYGLLNDKFGVIWQFNLD